MPSASALTATALLLLTLPGAASRRERFGELHARLGHGNSLARRDARDASNGIHKVGDIIFDEYRVLGRLPLPSNSLLELGQSFVDRGRNRMRWDFPLNLSRGEQALELDEGAHGVAFVVQDSQGHHIVLKFWHYDGHYVTWDQMSDMPMEEKQALEEHILKAAHECKILQDIDEQAKQLHSKPDNSVLLKGSQRLVHCYGNNADSTKTIADSHVPLHMKLNFAGLPWAVVRTIPPDLDAMRSLIKQLFEGLAFLRFAGWVHHDLKTENLVVKPGEDGVYALHIIDFDGSVQPSSADPSKYTTSTYQIAPQELEKSVSNFRVCPTKQPNEDECPYAFDIFSAGLTALEMACGVHLEQVLASAFDEATSRWKYSELDKISDESLIKTMKEKCSENFEEFATAVSGTTFWTLLRNTLRSKAEERPNAMDILGSDWLREVETPDDFELDISDMLR